MPIYSENLVSQYIIHEIKSAHSFTTDIMLSIQIENYVCLNTR